MKWKNHSDLEGRHAFLGASKYHWINYDPDKLRTVYLNELAVERGTQLHEFAHSCIVLHQKLPRSKITLNAFVNDAIGYGMQSEQILYYSDNCFGTADAIYFDKDTLRIHDLKTGTTPAHMEQLLIYAALFCLEYGYNPKSFKLIELRIYQNDDILVANPDPKQVAEIMDKIVKYSKIIDDIKEKEN